MFINLVKLRLADSVDVQAHSAVQDQERRFSHVHVRVALHVQRGQEVPQRERRAQAGPRGARQHC